MSFPILDSLAFLLIRVPFPQDPDVDSKPYYQTYDVDMAQ
jgi:hypothetical protein